MKEHGPEGDGPPGPCSGLAPTAAEPWGDIRPEPLAGVVLAPLTTSTPREAAGPETISGLPFFRRIAYMSSMRILIIEDDSVAALYLVKAFREAGHMADHAKDGVEGYDMARDATYDVLIVDRMLPKMDGLSLIGGLRKQKIETPVLILSALGQVDDRVKGLRAGGDDYLTNTYAFSELLARVEVLARRKSSGGGEETVYKVGGL